MTDTGIFYGTGAAEGVPSPFCDCPMCNYAREHGGKDVRKRSCFRLGRNIMIDMGPDIFTQALQYGSMCDIEHVLITHTHDDHFDFTALGLMSMATHLRQHRCISIFRKRAIGSLSSCVTVKSHLEELSVEWKKRGFMPFTS